MKQESLYKVGNEVTIKTCRDPGYAVNDYPYGFTDDMWYKYGGKKVRIVSILPMQSSLYDNKKGYVEPFSYKIEDCSFTWHASMFKETDMENVIKIPITNSTKTTKTQQKMINKTTNKTDNKPMEKKSMFSSIFDKYKSQFVYEKVDNLKVSMDGNICVPINGEYVAIDKDDNLVTYPKEACFDFPVYLISKQFSQVQPGDIVLINSTYAKVLSKTKTGTLNCLSFSGYTQNKKEIKDFVMGQAFIKVVVNVFSGFNTSGFNPMMLALMDGTADIKDILMMQMFQKSSNQGDKNGGFNFPFANNNMLMLAMLDKESDNDLIKTMMMMQFMQGMQSSNTPSEEVSKKDAQAK